MQPFGEITKSTPWSWEVTMWQWDIFPPLGSLVSAVHGERNIIACVNSIATGSRDPSRSPFAYQKTEEELRKEQPQIFSFLQTVCTCTVLGYQEESTYYYQLPPYPPKIHSFVVRLNQEQLDIFLSNTHFLSLLVSTTQTDIAHEELLLVMIKELLHNKNLHDSYFEDLIESWSLIVGNDYRRKKMFLRRVQNILKIKNNPLEKRTISILERFAD